MEALAANQTLVPGDMIGWYRIERVLGRGGFGITYLALDTNLDLHVAIKEYLPEDIAARETSHSVRPITDGKDATFHWGLDRFIKEARTLAKFKHGNIVRVMSVFEKNHTAYMIMEYEQGVDLSDLLDHPGFNEEHNLKKIIGPVLDGLAAVHEHGFIHRDIKPANIRIRHDQTPVLLDFGSARQAVCNRTQQLTAIVSVGYAPLEQYNDTRSDQQGPWTDIYALGGVLYHAISGKPPIASTLRASAVMNDQPDPLQPVAQTTNKNYSQLFLSSIDWALRFKVSDRPQSLDEWRQHLLAEGSTVMMPSGAVQPHSPTRDLSVHHPVISQRHDTRVLVRTSSTGTPAGTPKQHSSPPQMLMDEGTKWDTFRGAAPGTSKRTSRASIFRLPIGWLTGSLTAVATLATVAYLWINQGFEAKPDTNQHKTQPDTSSILQQDDAPPTHTPPAISDSTKSDISVDVDAPRVAEQKLEEFRQQAADKAETQKQRQAEEARREAEREALVLKQQAADAEAQREAEREALVLKQQAADAEAQREAEREALVLKQQAAIEPIESNRAESLQDAPAVPANTDTQLTNQPTSEYRNVPITNNDMEQVQELFTELKRAIENKDIAAILTLTKQPNEKSKLFSRLFNTFDSIEVKLSGFSAHRAKQLIQARLQISYLLRSNGNRQLAPESIRDITLETYRQQDGWSPILW